MIRQLAPGFVQDAFVVAHPGSCEHAVFHGLYC